MTTTETTLTINERLARATRFAAAVVAEYRFARTKVWSKGETVRVYIADPRDRGCVDILADGRLANGTRGLSRPISAAAAAIGAEVI